MPSRRGMKFVNFQPAGSGRGAPALAFAAGPAIGGANLGKIEAQRGHSA
jgi:hypothetical protein